MGYYNYNRVGREKQCMNFILLHADIMSIRHLLLWSARLIKNDV